MFSTSLWMEASDINGFGSIKKVTYIFDIQL